MQRYIKVTIEFETVGESIQIGTKSKRILKDAEWHEVPHYALAAFLGAMAEFLKAWILDDEED